MKTGPLRILIADDHATTRLGIKQILREEFPGVVIGEAGDAAGTIRQLDAGPWSLLILDISLPDHDGLALLGEIRRTHPGLLVLIFSVYPEDQFALRAIRAGASGYLAKERAPEDLALAVRRVLAGGIFASPSLGKLPVGGRPGHRAPLPHETLSPREFEVFRLVVTGRAGKAIAADLGVSQKTVSTHRTRILRKMNLRTTSDLVRYAIRMQLTV